MCKNKMNIKLILTYYILALIILSGFANKASAETYQFELKWGSLGSGDGQFNAPYGIAVDASGNVYVGSAECIQKFSSNGAFITKWGSFGNEDGQFDFIHEIAVDTLGNVYVVDCYNNRIQKFSSTGAFITKWGTYGLSKDGQFNYPDGIAVDVSGNVYVTDTFNHRIQKFSSNGAFITKWGSEGSGDGQFSWLIQGIAVDASGNVYVADSGSRRIQKFSSTGAFITKWGSVGNEDGQLERPSGIAVDASGNVYVADAYNFRIQKFSSTGAFITKWGSRGSGDGQFELPYGIALDALGNVYVVDVNNNRIQKFSPSVDNVVTTNIDTTSPGSVNRIDGHDLYIFSLVFGCTLGDTDWNSIADFNGDSIIDGNDLVTLGTNFGKVVGTVTATETGISFTPSDTPSNNSVYLEEISKNNDEITLTVKIKGGTDVSGAEMKITFDGSKIAYKSASEGNFLNQDGASTIFAAALEPGQNGVLLMGINRSGVFTGINGDGVLATIVLKSLAIQTNTSISFNTVNSCLKSTTGNIPGVSWLGGSLSYK